MSRNAHGILIILLSIVGVEGSVSAQEPTLSLGVVAVNGQQLVGAPQKKICANPGDRIDIEAYIRDWSVSKQPLAGYQVEVDPVSFASGAKGVIEPIGLQKSIETNTPDSKSSFVDRKHPQYIYKGLQSLDVTKSFGKGFRVAGVVVGDQGPISNQDGVPYYAGTMHFVISDNAAGRFVLVPTDDARKSVLVDQAADPIAPIHCEPIVIDVCGGMDALKLTGFIDSLLSTERKPDLQLPCSEVVVNENARVWLGLDALNAKLYSLDHSKVVTDVQLTNTQSTAE